MLDNVFQGSSRAQKSFFRSKHCAEKLKVFEESKVKSREMNRVIWKHFDSKQVLFLVIIQLQIWLSTKGCPALFSICNPQFGLIRHGLKIQLLLLKGSA